MKMKEKEVEKARIPRVNQNICLMLTILMAMMVAAVEKTAES